MRPITFLRKRSIERKLGTDHLEARISQEETENLLEKTEMKDLIKMSEEKSAKITGKTETKKDQPESLIMITDPPENSTMRLNPQESSMVREEIGVIEEEESSTTITGPLGSSKKEESLELNGQRSEPLNQEMRISTSSSRYFSYHVDPESRTRRQKGQSCPW